MKKVKKMKTTSKLVKKSKLDKVKDKNPKILKTGDKGDKSKAVKGKKLSEKGFEKKYGDQAV